MTSPSDYVGRLATVKTHKAPTPAGTYYALPAALSDGQRVRMERWVTAPDNHCNWWSVQPLDAQGLAAGPCIDKVWQKHLTGFLKG
ncbi:MAG: hypothetical protein FJ102_27285 [Deltaproteobacteria bacterium]|nr:hypothetical protein [Deltaproteobacteria bacterium]